MPIEKENPEVENEEISIEVEEEEQEEQETASAEETSEENEHEQYSDGVKKRIGELTYKMREAERREQAAIEYAKKIKEENESLNKKFKETSANLYNEYGGRVESQLAEAKRALKAAYEEGDSDALADAQALVARLAVESETVSRKKAKQEAEAEQEVSAPQTPASQAQQAPAPDPRAQRWASENDWFGKDEAMTFTAFSIHRKLVEEEGYDPTSEDYYHEVDSRIRKEFPHKFEGDSTGGKRKPAQTVAPATRNVKSGRKTVRLTQSQVAIAKKLGVPLEEYAKHVKEAS